MKAHDGARLSAGAVLDLGLEALKAAPPPASNANGIWEKVSPAIADRVPERRDQRRLSLLLAGGLAAAAVAVTVRLCTEPEAPSSAEVTWLAEARAPEAWVDDPAGESTERLWSALRGPGSGGKP